MEAICERDESSVAKLHHLVANSKSIVINIPCPNNDMLYHSTFASNFAKC